MSKNYMQVAADILRNRPDIMNNPQTKEPAQRFLSILESGDEKAGEQMGNEVLQNLGVSRQGFFKSFANLLNRRN